METDAELTIRPIADEYGGRLWRVQCGDRWEEHLDDSEALWTVVRFLNGDVMACLRTQDEHDKWNAKYNPKPLEPWQKQLAPAGGVQS